jgi:hypothetical protein
MDNRELTRDTEKTASRFRKVCLGDGTPVGFAGWSLEQATSEKGTTNSGDLVEEQEKTPDKRGERDKSHVWYSQRIQLILLARS